MRFVYRSCLPYSVMGPPAVVEPAWARTSSSSRRYEYGSPPAVTGRALLLPPTPTPSVLLQPDGIQDGLQDGGGGNLVGAGRLVLLLPQPLPSLLPPDGGGRRIEDTLTRPFDPKEKGRRRISANLSRAHYRITCAPRSTLLLYQVNLRVLRARPDRQNGELTYLAARELGSC